MLAQYRIWKERQFFADILREQIRKYAILESYSGRIIQKPSRPNYLNNATAKPVAQVPFLDDLNQRRKMDGTSVRPQSLLHLYVKKITFEKVNRDREININSDVFAFLRVGEWNARTEGVLTGPYTLEWSNLDIESLIPVNEIQINDLIIEIIDANPTQTDRTYIGLGRVAIDSVLGYNIGNDVTFTIPINDSTNRHTGNATLVLSAIFDLIKLPEGLPTDPKGVNFLEQLLPGNQSKVIANIGSQINGEIVSEQSKRDSIASEGSVLKKIVSVLRGDGDLHIVDVMAGKFEHKDMQKVGISVNKENLAVKRYIMIMLFFNSGKSYYAFLCLETSEFCCCK